MFACMDSRSQITEWLSEFCSAVQSPGLETVRALTTKFPDERTELTFAVHNGPQALGSGEHMSALVIATCDFPRFSGTWLASIGDCRLAGAVLQRPRPDHRPRNLAATS